MAEHDVAHASLVMEPAMTSREGRFTLHYTLNDGTSAIPEVCEVIVRGSRHSERVVKTIIAEVAGSVNHAGATCNINSATAIAAIGALPV